MADIESSREDNLFLNNICSTFTWAMSEGDVALPAEGPGWADRSVQVSGSFGGATVNIQGSNDGANYYTLNDPFSDPLTFTIEGLRAITELVNYIRPAVVGGAGTSITVTLLMRNPVT